jgi:hypothetical protein
MEEITLKSNCFRYNHHPSEVRIMESPHSPEIGLLLHQMYRSLRSWAAILVFFGGLFIFASGISYYLNSGFNPTGGIALIIVAILSLKIKIPAMLVIYAVVMGWAAVTSALWGWWGGGKLWLILSLVQIICTVLFVIQYRKYRHLRLRELFQAGNWPANLAPPRDEAVISGKFALASLILAGVPLILLMLITDFIAPQLYQLSIQLSHLTDILFIASGDLEGLALGLGWAAILTENTKKGLALATAGVVMSAIVLVVWTIYMLILPTLQ